MTLYGTTLNNWLRTRMMQYCVRLTIYDDSTIAPYTPDCSWNGFLDPTDFFQVSSVCK